MKTDHYGSWPSPITSELIATENIGLNELSISDESIYWLEMRPEEKGRAVIVKKTIEGLDFDIISSPFNARTRVHEYGGGSYLVAGETIYFSNFADQQLYQINPGSNPIAITQEEQCRFADSIIDSSQNRIISICEDHSGNAPEPINKIIAIPLNVTNHQEAIQPIYDLVSGSHFYTSPRLSQDDRYLCWISWNHPNMPWDETELWIAEIQQNGLLTNPQQIAGGKEESVMQPEWAEDGSLYFISDRTGWWNLYCWRDHSISTVLQMDAEFGEPQWQLKQSHYAFASTTNILCTYIKNGISHLACIDTHSGQINTIETPFTQIDSIQCNNRKAIFLASSPTTLTSIVEMELANFGINIIKSCSSLSLDSGYISRGEAIEFPTQTNQTAYGFFYPPTHPKIMAPKQEKPPLIVMSHGGPTSAAHNGLILTIQYFTSRGIAVLDVNYGGSSGYGRTYRNRLNRQWGIVDVDDCTSGALHLVSEGKVDKSRIAIRGGSAGGFTTLAALTFRQVFKAGASHYGVSDLVALAKDTHKFESRYLDKLVGPYPECMDLYQQRSPINAVEKLSCPVIFFQGAEDKVVPPNQTQRMVQALRKKGLAVAYIEYEGEQHGFRQAKNIKRTLDAELYFYAQIFCFKLADFIEPVEIENL